MDEVRWIGEGVDAREYVARLREAGMAVVLLAREREIAREWEK